MKQKYTSENTSVNSTVVPAIFKLIDWAPGTINVDIGGGKYDTATEFLASLWVKNLIYDPFNRPHEHNNMTCWLLEENKANTATVANVLNVVSEYDIRQEIIGQAYNWTTKDGISYFYVYEGDKSGKGKATRCGWQENRKTETYRDEIGKKFKTVERHGRLLIARK